MREAEETDLDALLHSAAPVRRPDDEDRVFSDVWSRVQRAMRDGDEPVVDAVEERRLTLIADREVAARRRRTARIASITLAVAVAGAGTAAAAEYFATHTGEELTGWEVDAG